MMSRRLSERALPDFSQLIDGSSQLLLTHVDEQRRVGELACDSDGFPRIYVGRVWLRSLAHLGDRRATAPRSSSRIDTVVSGEGGGAC